MDTHYQLETDALSIGLTKPATQFGVPLMAYYLNCMGCFLSGMLFSSFTQRGLTVAVEFFALFLFVHISMAMVTFRDAFGLAIFWMNVTRFKRPANFSFWNKTDSFSP